MRGQALTELTTEYVGALGRAAAEVLGGGEWLIGRDTRESGPALEQALIDGLRAGGATPKSLGVLPTPALAYLSLSHGAAGGDDHRVAQPVSRQRRQDLRCRRSQADQRDRAGDRGGDGPASDRRRSPPDARPRRPPSPSTATTSSTRSPPGALRRADDRARLRQRGDVRGRADRRASARRRRDRDQRRAERTQHQRTMRGDPHRRHCRPRSSPTAPTSGWRSTATATG